MSYLVGMLLVIVTMAIFLRILSVFERGEWPSEGARTPGKALRELILGRRAS
ncbi:MAG: hypothetical protein NTW87_30395 [Planctomycetota bacterium]|nr:hypothetical protein [Planctomycetota bacterium]